MKFWKMTFPFHLAPCIRVAYPLHFSQVLDPVLRPLGAEVRYEFRPYSSSIRIVKFHLYKKNPYYVTSGRVDLSESIFDVGTIDTY